MSQADCREASLNKIPDPGTCLNSLTIQNLSGLQQHFSSPLNSHRTFRLKLIAIFSPINADPVPNSAYRLAFISFRNIVFIVVSI